MKDKPEKNYLKNYKYKKEYLSDGEPGKHDHEVKTSNKGPEKHLFEEFTEAADSPEINPDSGKNYVDVPDDKPYQLQLAENPPLLAQSSIISPLYIYLPDKETVRRLYEGADLLHGDMVRPNLRKIVSEIYKQRRFMAIAMITMFFFMFMLFFIIMTFNDGFSLAFAVLSISTPLIYVMLMIAFSINYTKKINNPSEQKVFRDVAAKYHESRIDAELQNSLMYNSGRFLLTESYLIEYGGKILILETKDILYLGAYSQRKGKSTTNYLFVLYTQGWSNNNSIGNLKAAQDLARHFNYITGSLQVDYKEYARAVKQAGNNNAGFVKACLASREAARKNR